MCAGTGLHLKFQLLLEVLNSFEAISYQWAYRTIYGTQLAILNDFRRQLYIKLLHNRFLKIVKETQESSAIILK